MLQAFQAQRSLAVVSVCAMGSKLLRKGDDASVIYRAPQSAPVTTVRIEPVAEVQHAEPPTPITILYRGGGCALHGSRLMHGFGKAAQLYNGFDIRKEIKAAAAGFSAYRRGRRVGEDWITKHESWKRKRSTQWK